MYIMVVPVLNKHPDTHHQSTILHTTSSTAALAKFIERKPCTKTLFESSVDGSLFAYQGVMTREHFTIRYHDVACDTILLLIRVARSQLFSVLLIVSRD
jgi:hypothetical protein